MSKAKRNFALFFVGLVLAGAYAVYRFNENLKPLPSGPPQLIRYDASAPLSTILHDLENRQIIRSAGATGLYARVKRRLSVVEAGTYEVAPGMDADQLIKALQKPVTVKVTVPEYYWIARTAALMEEKNIAKADEFVAEANNPKQFDKNVEFNLPQTSLEGYLFPDTYKMQPMVGAKAAIRQQLDAFDRKVWQALRHPKNLNRAVIIASMVEREAKFDSERPIIAGVIENRLAKGMPLEIDATVLYAQQRWHIPTRADIRQTISPYNTYLNKGLPPGPICSPGLKSIEAALHPAKTPFLYYVALPNGHSLFGKTLQEHQANIAKRKQAMR